MYGSERAPEKEAVGVISNLFLYWTSFPTMRPRSARSELLSPWHKNADSIEERLQTERDATAKPIDRGPAIIFVRAGSIIMLAVRQPNRIVHVVRAAEDGRREAGSEVVVVVGRRRPVGDDAALAAEVVEQTAA